MSYVAEGYLIMVSKIWMVDFYLIGGGANEANLVEAASGTNSAQNM